MKWMECPTCEGTCKTTSDMSRNPNHMSSYEIMWMERHGALIPCPTCDPGDGPTGRVCVMSDDELKAMSLYFTGEWVSDRKDGIDTIDKIFVDAEIELEHRREVK